MTPTASIKQELHELIDGMDFDQAVRVLAMIGLANDDEDLSPEEEAELLEGIAAVERGEVISGEQIERELGLEL